MKPLDPKTILQGRYEISHLIGKGGMGEVYLAVDTRLGHSVALKRTTVGDDAALAEAFEQEGRTLAQLRHSVLPKVSDHFLENEQQFLVMDYIEGEDLATRMKSMTKPFPLEWVLFWADQLLEALGYLHKHDPPIIHRDIKPQNLKLTAENQIILLDFGLSKRSIGNTKVTSSGSVVGYTPHYAPMEQIRGTGTNARSDIYSLSATLYQLLTMDIPPDALSRADAMLGGSADTLKPLTELNNEISQTLSDIIVKGMEISQEKRHQSAREMQKELRRAFNELRASMSAETVAFNVEDEGISIDDAKTEVISDLDLPGETAPPAEAAAPPVQEAGTEDFSSFDKTEIIDSSEVRSIAADEDFDSTMKKGLFAEDLDSEPSEPVAADDIAEDFSDAPAGESYATQEDIGDQFGSGTESASDQEFKTSESIDSGGSFEPEATVPLISLDDAAGTDAPDVPDSGMESGEPDFGGAAESYPDDFSSADDGEEVAAAEAAPAAAGFEASGKSPREAAESKSSAGKYVAILGGLGVLLLVLLGSAVAIGWYVTYGGFGTGTENSNTAPDAETSVEPTPFEEPTPEPANTEIVDDTNSNTADDTNSNTEDTQISSDPGDSQDAQTTRTPKTTTPVVTRPTRKPVAAPTKRPVTTKPTEKPTSKPKPRDPGILQ